MNLERKNKLSPLNFDTHFLTIFFKEESIPTTKSKCITIADTFPHVKLHGGFFSFDINYREPSVERLSFHLEGEEPVVFEDHENLEDVIQKPHIRDTKFLGWFEANKKYHEAKDLTNGEFPMKFVWKASERRWSPRQRGILVGRIHFVPPGSGEIFYLWLLLNFVKGPSFYNDIYTVSGKKYNTFKEACFALGLIDDDKEFIDAINQSSIWGTASYMRRLFV